MIKMAAKLLCMTFIVLLMSCSQQTAKKPLRIGFNLWPGYEFIYLAKVKGFYEKRGLNVKLVELNALGDVRRAFERGQIDIMASTMVEMLIAAENAGKPLRILLVADASNGSDMLVTRKNIRSVAELKGKTLGLEGATVDVLVAGAALRSAGLTFKDVTIVGKAQDDLLAELMAGQIDAMQTYPPYSTQLLKTNQYHAIFDTSNIPGEIIDILSVDARVLDERQEDIRSFMQAYFDAFDYFQSNPEEASTIMGARERISGAEFREALRGVTLIPRDKQLLYLESGAGMKALKKACDDLIDSGWILRKVDIKQFFDHRVIELYR